MLGVILFYFILSPLLPMIYLLKKYFENGSNRIVISLIMLVVCALFLFLGEFYADHSHGFDGMRALGAVWGGFAGMIISVIFLIMAIMKMLI